MKYQAYAEYKDSGVEWLDCVPNDWDVTKLKYVASIFGRIGFRGYTVNDIVSEGEGAIVLSPSNIDEDQFSLDKKAYLSWEKYYESPEIMVEVGDVLLVKTGSTFGKSAIVKKIEEPMTINPQMALIKNSNIDSRFLTYLLNSTLLKAKIEINNTGSGMPTMTQENINRFPVPRPNNVLANQIANFLDHETAKIDTLIEKQQQLIQLLKEKRQAVISHAVTKGLNPDVPMRDSGVEWLGEVPQHWVRKVKLSSVAESNRGSFVNGPFGSDLLANELINDGIPVIYIRDLKRTGYKRKSTVCVTEEKAKQLDVCRVQAGDVLISKVGDPPGDACVYPENEPDAIITQDVIRIRVDRKVVSPFFLTMLLNSDFGQMVINDISVEGTRKRVSLGDFKATRFILPSLNEQEDIVAFVVEQCKKMDNLIVRSKSAVELIKERRTALISAAVTGKIDVRNWQPSKAVAA